MLASLFQFKIQNTEKNINVKKKDVKNMLYENKTLVNV